MKVECLTPISVMIDGRVAKKVKGQIFDLDAKAAKPLIEAKILKDVNAVEVKEVAPKKKKVVEPEVVEVVEVGGQEDAIPEIN